MFYDRLADICKENGTSITSFLVSIGRSRSAGSYLKKSNNPDMAMIELAVKRFGVSADWLLGISDARRPSVANELDAREFELICSIRNADTRTKQIVYDIANAAMSVPLSEDVPPVISASANSDAIFSRASGGKCHGHRPDTILKRIEGDVAAGVPITAVAEDADAVVRLPNRYASDRYFVVRASGDSMTGFGVEDGDYVVLDRDSSFDDNCVALVAVEGLTDQPDLTLKRIHRSGRNIVLYSYNSAYPPMTYPAREVALKGEYVEAFSPEDCLE